jgi:hypothetical protein
MRTSKRGRRRPASEQVRIDIGKMWDAGATRLEIADALQVPDADVRYHLQRAGVPPQEQHKPHPVAGGKRICVQCKKNLELARYPSPRHAICLDCVQKNSASKK